MKPDDVMSRNSVSASHPNRPPYRRACKDKLPYNLQNEFGARLQVMTRPTVRRQLKVVIHLDAHVSFPTPRSRSVGIGRVQVPIGVTLVFPLDTRDLDPLVSRRGQAKL